MTAYKKLAIKNVDDFIFGKCPHPVKLKNGMVIGGGQVYPELNFTLPALEINKNTISAVYDQYDQMIKGVCKRAAELFAPGLVVEFELLPELTKVPAWGAKVTEILKAALNELQEKHSIPTALRVTPNDIREFERPPLMRRGELLDQMMESFSECAKAGADFLAIESTGGKELHDDAILNGDLDMSVFALGVLGARDMAFLWERISAVGKQHNAIPSGDTACGFANTAMVLAEQRFIPRVWAALIRVFSAPRSLVAYEHGAVGPNKDCGYEGVYLKAITGCPISLEGAESACAHLSPIGNITKALPDLWSNESVQNVKLLSAMAPTVSVEQLIYAARLMNTATEDGKQSALKLRDLLSASDAYMDPQAYVLQPVIAHQLAGEMIQEESAYARTRRAAQSAAGILQKAHSAGEFQLKKNEVRWLEKLARKAQELPEGEGEFIQKMLPRLPENKVLLSEYGL